MAPISKRFFDGSILLKPRQLVQEEQDGRAPLGGNTEVSMRMCWR